MLPEDDFDVLLGQLARGDLPWAQAWTADFSAFAERFTLHDSNWIGLFIPGAEENEAYLVIEWDGHWLPEPLRTTCMEDSPHQSCPSWPILFIKVSGMSGVQLFDFENVSCGGKVICEAEFSVQEGIKVLEIENMFGGAVRLKYSGSTKFLALSRKNFQILGLASVEPRPDPPEPALRKKPWWKFW